jgi:hypothetical protein
MPFILGTMFTPNRDLAKVIGLGAHIVNGWLFAIVYAFVFENLHAASWGIGAILGAAQGMFIVVVLLPALPGLHPRMVSDFRGPEPARLLEPPGYFTTNYGFKTPFVLLLAHVVYGGVLGMFYTLR